MDPNSSETPNTTTSVENSKPIYRHPAFYFAILLLLLLSLIVVLIYPLKGESDLLGSEYRSGLEKDHATVVVFNTLKKYPFNDFDNATMSVNLNIFEGLTIQRDGELKPGLAVSWTNPDPLTWRLKLRPDVKFHSGDILKASDVKYTIEQAKVSEGDSEWVSKGMAAQVASVNVVDDLTVELKTEEPNATLLYWLLYLGIVSEDQVKRDGLDNAVGTGPYKLVSLEDRKVELEVNNNYWTTPAKVKKLTYIQNDNDEERLSGLRNGTMDIVSSTIDVHKNLVSEGFQVKPFRTGDITFYILDILHEKTKGVNTNTNPFKDINVRKAIYLALDVPKLVKAYGLGAGESVSQFATQELVGYNSSLVRPARNVEEAKELMKDAGYQNGFEVTIDILTGGDRVYNDELSAQLAEIGIKAKINEMEPNAFFDKLFSGDYTWMQANYIPDTTDSVDLIKVLFQTKALANASGYSNSDVDDLIKKASATFDIEQRSMLTRQAHAKIMEDLPMIPVFTRVNYIVMPQDIDFKIPPTGHLLGYEMSGREEVK